MKDLFLLLNGTLTRLTAYCQIAGGIVVTM